MAPSAARAVPAEGGPSSPHAGAAADARKVARHSAMLSYCAAVGGERVRVGRVAAERSRAHAGERCGNLGGAAAATGEPPWPSQGACVVE
eukprot:4556851-Prymnesium_polylepis.1